MRDWLLSVAAIAVMSTAAGACGAPAKESLATPSPVAGFGSDLSVDNASDLPVQILVNGQVVGIGPARRLTTFPGNLLPAMPWTVEARSPSGRLVLALDVQADDISRTVAPDGHSSLQGAGNRVDLSCGRLDLWVGVPMLGPAPGPGVPGDCVP